MVNLVTPTITEKDILALHGEKEEVALWLCACTHQEEFLLFVFIVWLQ